MSSMYNEFFTANGLEDKTYEIKFAFLRPLNAISPAMMLGWLSEWSKTVHSALLKK